MGGAAEAEEAVVANTDNNLSRLAEWQLGHCGWLSERTRASNW
jgi:hypothetical protein